MPTIFSKLGINFTTPFCNLSETEAELCMLEIGSSIVKQKISSNCKKSCSNLKYFGAISGSATFLPTSYMGDSFKKIPELVQNKRMYYCLSYVFNNDEFLSNVYVEYLIYDTIGMIGSVGGTLGMLLKEKQKIN